MELLRLRSPQEPGPQRESGGWIMVLTSQPYHPSTPDTDQMISLNDFRVKSTRAMEGYFCRR